MFWMTAALGDRLAIRWGNKKQHRLRVLVIYIQSKCWQQNIYDSKWIPSFVRNIL